MGLGGQHRKRQNAKPSLPFPSYTLETGSRPICAELPAVELTQIGLPARNWSAVSERREEDREKSHRCSHRKMAGAIAVRELVGARGSHRRPLPKKREDRELERESSVTAEQNNCGYF